MYALCNNLKIIAKPYNLTSFRPFTKLIKNEAGLNLFSNTIKGSQRNKLCQKLATKAVYDINTNVAKDVILYQYENPKFFKIINIFAISQFLFWTYLSHFAFTSLRDVPVEGKKNEDDPWYKKINLGENKYRNTLALFSFLTGYVILSAAWLFTLRSVRFLVLQKGGNSVSFVTYTPFNKNNRIMSVPLKCLSAETSRESAKVQLPIKVKNRALYYILDMRGQFNNPKLFDYTVGLKRKLN